MRRLLGKALLLGILALSGCLLYFSARIGRQSRIDEAKPADAILVLGAAEYRGRPSPVLRARLDHALTIYRQKLAPILITTGGAGGDPDYTEGGVGRSYLIEHNVPSEAIIVEP
jgi:vancomycin permeability regulator SanA